MDASGLRAHPRSEAGAAKVHGYTSSQMFQSCSVNNRFTKVEAGSNISVRLDAGVIERRSEINLTVAFD
jgi:hypothetical protein